MQVFASTSRFGVVLGFWVSCCLCRVSGGDLMVVCVLVCWGWSGMRFWDFRVWVNCDCVGCRGGSLCLWVVFWFGWGFALAVWV